MSAKVLCIDIGGSKILTGIMDEKGNVLYRQKRLFDRPDRKSVIDAMLEESEAVLRCSCWKDAPDEEITAIGVSIPGLADRQKGLWVYAPFSKIQDLDVRRLLEERFHRPVFLDNDANACAVAEKRFGCAKGVHDLIWITVSNGVGAGLMLRDRLYDGTFRRAGELGHVKVVDDGDLCPCGGRGCLEAYASGPAIVRRYAEKSGGNGDVTALEISERARLGEETALEVFREEGYYLGKAIAMVVDLLDLPLVVIGGGVSGSFDLFEPELHRTLKKHLFKDVDRELKVLPTALGYEASLIGAGALALYGDGHIS